MRENTWCITLYKYPNIQLFLSFSLTHTHTHTHTNTRRLSLQLQHIHRPQRDHNNSRTSDAAPTDPHRVTLEKDPQQEKQHAAAAYRYICQRIYGCIKRIAAEEDFYLLINLRWWSFSVVPQCPRCCHTTRGKWAATGRTARSVRCPLAADCRTQAPFSPRRRRKDPQSLDRSAEPSEVNDG